MEIFSKVDDLCSGTRSNDLGKGGHGAACAGTPCALDVLTANVRMLPARTFQHSQHMEAPQTSQTAN